ncbi:MAG TPA: SMP-30/gluconolactonase/LRE family protein [Oligoflexus sp.]|uniref:SMP-30/gluconolactonase/LRE family protein n=1 Tax=Oligoflexus sp. TaxID=1971216 RepID=UPI002D7E6828|nr:SMP-30/gluconolactonase/LRE family protein [Oligoflexus sp.]HET9239651.1 SMP-30/gluconolactonase/LRE family protein [Oligoflexus sp.]
MPGFRLVPIMMMVLVSGCRPTGFDAQAWLPPENPGLLKTLPPNQDLAQATAVGAGAWDAPEDIAVDGAGRVYAGTLQGRVQRLAEDGEAQVIAEFPGQVLGLDFDANGNLYVCVDRNGLWRLDPNGRKELVVNSHAGKKLGLLDDVKVGPDGLVYFTEASSKYTMRTYLRDILEGVETGRLLRYDPASKTTVVLLDGLGFANGLTVANDASYVLVAETSRYRIRKYWLSGPESGKNVVLLDNLPGFPDGLSRMVDGKIWVAFIAPRNALLDKLHPKPFMKNILAGMPAGLLPKDKPYGLIASMTETGQWLQSLHDPIGQVVPAISSVETQGEKLWLGSLEGKALYSITPKALLK